MPAWKPVKRLLRSALRVTPLSLTLATVIVIVALFWVQVPILDLIELRTYDLRFASRGPLPASRAVVLAVIDEKSLDTEGRWPWPRAKLARLIDVVSRDGAKVIAFDIGFSEPDDNSGREILDRVGKAVGALGVASPGLEQVLNEARQQADNDGALARAIRESPAAIVLGYFFHMSERHRDYDLDQAEIGRQLELISASRYPLVIYRTAEAENVDVPRAYAPESNLRVFTELAKSSGYFTVKQDADGVVRWMPLVIQAGNDVFPPLSILAAWHYLDQPRLAVSIGARGVEEIGMGDRAIPTDESGRLLINYLGPPQTFPHVSITDVLGGKVPAGTFRDRIVLVGATASGIYDARSTPFSPVFPGVEIHATIIDNILTRHFVTKPAWSSAVDVFAIVALAALVGVVLPRLNAVSALLFSGALLVAYIVGARALFVRLGLWLNVVYPLLAIAVNYTAISAYHYLIERRERKAIRSAFGQYVAPVVVEAMLKDPTRLKLGGEEQVLTVLFSDLQGFTAYSERYAPHEMFQFLSEYYGRMTERIFAHGGMLKDYIGDELMAIFGAPVEQVDHAIRACAAALDMCTLRNRMAKEWLAIGRPALSARTGINSGVMLVGNIGSEYRLTYSVLGDNVNLASRLEGLNKEYGTEILIGENTATLVGDAFVLREIDVVRVVGKTKSTRIYELLAALGTSRPPGQEEMLGNYTAALVAYRAQRWDEALRLFEAALMLWPSDGPSRVMAKRCQTNAETPLSADWDGVFEAKKK